MRVVRSISLTLCCAMFLLASMANAADLIVSPMFTDHMVLQRGMKIPVWGVAEAGANVTVELNGKSKSAKAGADGKWMVRLKSMKAGGPYELKVSDGARNLKFADVLIGDVWLCSGQSNMALPTAEVVDAKAEIAKANNFPNIRLYSVSPWGGWASKPSTGTGGKWMQCNADNATSFSAVGYFFGRTLAESTGTLKGVPIGLINSSRGATRIESWMDKQYLAQHFNMKDLRDSAFGATISSCYNGMINPIVPYGLKGVVWYQGESNAGRPEQYRALFASMIQEWRGLWNEKNMPFLFVQLPSYGKKFDDDYFTALREVQLESWQTIPHTGMAVTIDVGSDNDVHPKNKLPVGTRLALLARGLVYDEDVDISGPIYKSQKIEGNKIRVKFRYVDGGLSDINKGELQGFEIAGADKQFKEATAKIEGKTVVVESKDVASPKYVRYAWAPVPKADLYSQASLPASPFRTAK